MRNKRVLLGITGSIAAYKAPEMVRYLRKRGCQVRVVLSQSAAKLVSELALETVSGYPVTTEFWNEKDRGGIGHIALADWADVFLIAPATADTIAKLAWGYSDTPLHAIALATRAPIVIAPAMNVNMYEHVQTQENIEKLKGRGVIFCGPDNGLLACGWRGAGRLAPVEEIKLAVDKATTEQDLKGKRVLVTAGPTREMIDPVRFLSNRSSGKMGLAIAKEALCRGADVTLIHGPINLRVPDRIRAVPVVSAAEMAAAVKSECSIDVPERTPDIVIMTAAVADYRPAEVAEQKIKKSKTGTSLDVLPNPDILASLGAARGERARPLLVGFAVETSPLNELKAEMQRKLKEKRIDLIVGNLASEAFEGSTNRVWIFGKDGSQCEIPLTKKKMIAKGLFDIISEN